MTQQQNGHEKDRISELKDRSIEMSQSEEQKEI